MPWCNYLIFSHWTNFHSKYEDGFYISMINDKDGHISSPLIMLTCPALRYAPLEWQKHNVVDPKASKSNLNGDRPDRSNYFNHENDGGKNTSCCSAMGRKLLTRPGIADTYIFLMKTWNTLPESYKQSVYNNTLATVKRQIRQGQSPMPAVVITMEAVSVDNAIPLDYLTFKVAFEEPVIGSTDTKIPIENHCPEDELHLGIPAASRNFEDDGEESGQGNVIPTPRRRRRPVTELERFDLGTGDVDWNDGEDGDDADADADQVEEALRADDG